MNSTHNTFRPVIDYRKASYSDVGGGNCVEVADGIVPCADGCSARGEHRMRDTQNRELGHLAFGSSAWNAFLAAAK